MSESREVAVSEGREGLLPPDGAHYPSADPLHVPTPPSHAQSSLQASVQLGVDPLGGHGPGIGYPQGEAQGAFAPLPDREVLQGKLQLVVESANNSQFYGDNGIFKGKQF